MNRYPLNRDGLSDRLKAEGNLGYLDFLRLICRMWEDAYPNIPLRATGPDKPDAVYPAIVYRLDLRKPHPSEPKPRYREEIKTAVGQDAIIIAAQRFQNVITFTAIAQQDPQQAETLVEVFEDFILQFTPVFKQLGVSELVYARRLPDGNDQRPGLGVVERSVSYLVTFEKTVVSEVKKLEQVLLDARVFIASNQATPNSQIVSGYSQTITDQHATPNFG